MATSTAVLDYRRPDLRTNVLQNPYWISSALVGFNISSKYAVVFQWPTAGTKTLVYAVCLQIVTAYVTATSAWVGFGTTDVPDIVPASTTLTYDASTGDYILTADITTGTAGFYGPTTANTSTWLTARLTDTWASPNLITGAATTTPCVFVSMGGTLTAGACRVHMLIADVPGSF